MGLICAAVVTASVFLLSEQNEWKTVWTENLTDVDNGIVSCGVLMWSNSMSYVDNNILLP